MLCQMFFYDENDQPVDATGPIDLTPNPDLADEEGDLYPRNANYRPGDTVQVFTRILLWAGKRYVVTLSVREPV